MTSPSDMIVPATTTSETQAPAIQMADGLPICPTDNLLDASTMSDASTAMNSPMTVPVGVSTTEALDSDGLSLAGACPAEVDLTNVAAALEDDDDDEFIPRGGPSNASAGAVKTSSGPKAVKKPTGQATTFAGQGTR